MERLLDAVKPGHAVLALLAVELGQAAARFDARPPAGLLSRLLVDLAAIAAGLAVSAFERGFERLTEPRSEGGPEPRDAFLVGGVALLVTALLGLGLGTVSGSAALGYGGIALFLGLWRRAPLFGAAALGRGLDEGAVIAALGPAAVLAGFAALAGEGSGGAFYAGVPVGLAAAAALSVDRVADAVGVLLALGATAAILVVRSLGEAPHGAWPACLPLIALAGLGTWRQRRPLPAEGGFGPERLALGLVVAADLVLLIVYRLAGSP
jgi:MYXO-CTERM domain-containing protein